MSNSASSSKDIDLKKWLADDRVGFILWVILPAFFLWRLLHTGFSDDEGLFALQAERLIQSPFQLPNVDYMSAYPGGMAFYNAFWLKLLGNKLSSMRVGLIVLFCLWMPSVYWLARKFMPVIWSHVATLFVLSSSIFIYPAIGANWYALVCGWLSWCLLFDACYSESAQPKHKRVQAILSGFLLAVCLIAKQTVALYTGLGLWYLLILNSSGVSGHSINAKENPSPSLNNIFFIALGFLVLLFYSFQLVVPHLLNPAILILFALPLLYILLTAYKAVMNAGFIFSKSQWLNVTLKHLLLGFLIGFLLLPAIIFTLKGGSSVKEWFILSFWEMPNQLAGMFFQPYPLMFGFISIIIATFTVILVSTLIKPNQAFLKVSTGLFLFGFLAAFIYSGDQWEMYLASLLLEIPVSIMVGVCAFSLLKNLTQKMQVLFVFGILIHLGTIPVFATPYFATSFAPLCLFLIVFIYYWQLQARPDTLSKAVLFFITALMMLSYAPKAFRTVVQSERYPYLKLPKGDVRVEETIQHQYQGILNFIENKVSSSENIYLLSNANSELYYLTNHRSPTAYDYHYYSKRTNGSDIIEKLKLHHVKYVLIPEADSQQLSIQPLLKQHLQEHYTIGHTLNKFIVLEKPDPS